MQRVAELVCGKLTLFHIVAVAFVYYDSVGHFHDTAFDALQFVTRSGQLDQQEKVYHRVACRLALPHSYCLYKYLVKSCRLA